MRSAKSDIYFRAIKPNAEVEVESIYDAIIALNTQGAEVADGLIHDLVRAVARRSCGRWSPAQLIALHTIAESRPESAIWRKHLPARPV